MGRLVVEGHGGWGTAEMGGFGCRKEALVAVVRTPGAVQRRRGVEAKEEGVRGCPAERTWG